MSDMEKKLADALKPFTFRPSNPDGSPRHDQWTASGTRVTIAAVFDRDVMTARKAFDEYLMADHD